MVTTNRQPMAADRDQHFFWFLVVSLMLHVVIGGLLRTLDRPRFIPPKTIEIELAPAGSPEKNKVSGAKEVAKAPVPPQPQRAKIPLVEPKLEPQTKPIAKPVPQVASDPVPKATPKPVLEKKPQPNVNPQPDTPQPKAVPAEKIATPKQTLSDVRKLLKAKAENIGDAGIEGGFALPTNVKGRLYNNQIVSAVQAVWSSPEGVRDTSVKVKILISSSGKLIDSKIVDTSGDPLYDRSALNAIKIADFPAPPADFKIPVALILNLIPPER